jgi:hypothetical protein
MCFVRLEPFDVDRLVFVKGKQKCSFKTMLMPFRLPWNVIRLFSFVHLEQLLFFQKSAETRWEKSRCEIA